MSPLKSIVPEVHPREAGSLNSAVASFVSGGVCKRFTGMAEVVSAYRVEEVAPALERIRDGVAKGYHAAGYLAYESAHPAGAFAHPVGASAFDPALATHAPNGAEPVLWFGLFEEAVEEPLPKESRTSPIPELHWKPGLTEAQYSEASSRIREYIAAGDTYQVNFTFPTVAQILVELDPWAWFCALYARQPVGHAGYIDTGARQVLSLSPELFFELDGARIATRPMKGTRRRGLWPEQDARAGRELAASAKDRAENVMIVDLLRNDLGRICRTGSVRVESLFDVERYDTLWQMTSTVSGETDAEVPEILSALFPSGSITGAPKIRTSEIIRELEPSPRGVYCGTVGWWSPGRKASFNVAIRTITVDAERGEARYAVGSGVTWDSVTAHEYEECLLKAKAIHTAPPEFELLETMLWDGGFTLLDEHMSRIAASADYFRFGFDEARVRAALDDALSERAEPAKVRLLLDRSGTFRIEVHPVDASPDVSTVAWAADPVDADDVFLYHKTTHRTVYDEARAVAPDADDVLLWNTRGEVTEATFANIVVEIDGELFTPPVASGLLAGTLREQLLREGAGKLHGNGMIRERIITREDVSNAERLWLINSVRGWTEATMVESAAKAAS